MSQLKDDLKEPEIEEKFVQTYLIISGLLLSRIQNSTEINNIILLNKIGDFGFILFILFILIYYTIPSLAFIKNNIFIDSIDSLLQISAIIASFGLALQITSAVMGINDMIITLLPITGLIACTLTPRRNQKIIILKTVAYVTLLVLGSIIIYGTGSKVNDTNGIGSILYDTKDLIIIFIIYLISLMVLLLSLIYKIREKKRKQT
jgi:hypothetical protein